MGSILFLLELYVYICDCRGACIGAAIIIDFGKQVRIVCLMREGRVSELEAVSVAPLP